MSLIHEALRKARREASHQDDPGVVFPGGLTGRGRQSGLRVGVILGIATTVFAGAIIGGGLWWTFRTTPDEAVESAEPAGVESAQSLASAAAAPQSPDVVATGSPADPTSDPGPTDDSDGLSDKRSEDADHAGAQPGTATSQDADAEIEEPRAAPATQSATASGEREFMVDADLGYASLSLDYIMVSPTESFAQINGLEVRVGGVIEGFTVEEITEDLVKMRDDRGPLVLRVPSSP